MITKITTLKDLLDELDGTSYKEEILKSCTKTKIAYTSERVDKLLSEKIDIILSCSDYDTASKDVSDSISRIMKLLK